MRRVMGGTRERVMGEAWSGSYMAHGLSNRASGPRVSGAPRLGIGGEGSAGRVRVSVPEEVGDLEGKAQRGA